MVLCLDHQARNQIRGETVEGIQIRNICYCGAKRPWASAAYVVHNADNLPGCRVGGCREGQAIAHLQVGSASSSITDNHRLRFIGSEPASSDQLTMVELCIGLQPGHFYDSPGCVCVDKHDWFDPRHVGESHHLRAHLLKRMRHGK